MSAYTGVAWTGPLDGVCDTCHKAGSVSQLVHWARGAEIARLPRFQCQACSHAEYDARKAARKAELAAMPRCEVPGCRARGKWTVGAIEQVRLCGRHLTAARAAHYRRLEPVGGLALFLGGSRGGTSGKALLASLNP